MTETESAPSRLTIFHVADTRNRRDIKSRTIGHILEDHRTDIPFVSILEELQLKIDDGLHRQIECMAALLDSLNIVACTIHFLFGIKQSFLLLAIHTGTILLIIVKHIGKSLRNIKIWYPSTIDCKGHRTILRRIHNEIGRYLLHVATLCLSQGSTWFRIQPHDFFLQLFYRIRRDFQLLGYPFPTVVHQFFEIIGDNLS